MAVTAGHRYPFGPGVALDIRGPAVVLRHFDAEFGSSVLPDTQPQVEVEIKYVFGRRRPEPGRGGHKTALWHISLTPPDRSPLRATIQIAGGPPSFALSLVQGYFVEPLVAFALARAGFVALPSAGIEAEDGALVLMGKSRSGKSSLSVRAIAAGRPVLGDDQVIVDASGSCRPYPRRLRVYPDIRETAPAGWAALPRGTRSALTARRAVKRLTRGLVAPSLAVAQGQFGASRRPPEMPIRRLAVIERADGIDALAVETRDGEWAVEAARDILADQRRAFLKRAGAPWTEHLPTVLDAEARILAQAWSGLEVEHVRVPGYWPAAQAVGALEARLRTIA